MIKSFSVKNYRNLDIDNLELGRINLMVGPNNSGKSNFMRALSFFSEMMKAEQDKHLTAFYRVLNAQGWDSLLRKGLPKPSEIEMNWVFNTENGYSDFTYGLTFSVDKADGIPTGFHISREEFKYESSGLADLRISRVENSWQTGKLSMLRQDSSWVDIGITSMLNESVFRQGRFLLEDPEFRMNIYPEFKKLEQSLVDYFDRFHQYTCNDFQVKAVNEPTDIALKQEFLNETGSEFVNVISYLDERYNFIDDYTDRLRELIPKLKRIKIVHISETKRQLQLVIGGETFKLSEMSYGTIQVMLLTLLLWTPERMSILSLDEPEINLHPAWVKVIGDWVTKSPSASQIFISTHSPDLLDRFTELYRQGEVALFTFHLDQTPTVKRVYPDKLDVFFQQGWELGDLYRVGEPELGGWPW